MPISFDDCPEPEPSKRTGFSHNTLVRDSERRTDAWLPEALANPATRYFAFSQGKVFVNDADQAGTRLDKATLAAFEPDLDEAILLGNDGDVPVIAVPVAADAEAVEPPWQALDFRGLLYASSVSEEDAGAIAQAGALIAWAAGNRHCGRCGGVTTPAIGGMRRDCAGCGRQTFPRTDPVVIMLLVDGERCVLGRSHHFPTGWYSCLAGFVEPGETIEDAVRREGHEESGVRIGRVKYFASQPWPFPHSLMIGCFCEAISGQIDFDTGELDDCRWFARDEVRAMIAGEHAAELRAPPSKSIAAQIIREWVNG